MLDNEMSPIIYKPMVPSFNLTQWCKDNREQFESDLTYHGAILLRGFGIETMEDFERVIDVIIPTKVSYTEGATPRTKLRNGLYTSTEFPAEQYIALHNVNMLIIKY